MFGSSCYILYTLMLFCDVQMCPEAAKFRTSPLQDEDDMKIIFDKNVVTNVTARVPGSSQARASQSTINVDEDGSGCEGEDDSNVTPLRSWGNNKRACPYSRSASATPRLRSGPTSAFRLDRMMDLMEKRTKTRKLPGLGSWRKRRRGLG